MASLLPNGKQQYFDNAGLPLVGGKLYTYAASTTTPKATYTDANGLIPNTNPIILDSRGEATVFWDGAYRVELRDSLDNPIWTIDGVAESNLDYRTSSTGSAIIPAGTTAQRDNPGFPGYFRYNSDNEVFEGYYGADWKSLPKAVNGVDIPDDGNIVLKSVNGTSIVGAGNIIVQDPLVSGVNVKTVAGVDILGAGDIPFKTVGGISVQGVGDISPNMSTTRVGRTGNVILDSTNRGNFIDVESGTFTQTFDTAANLGSGWCVWYRNQGTAEGEITLDPAAAELIDGLSSFIMYPGEVRFIQCDGSTLRSFVVSPFRKTITTTGPFVKPPGYTYYGGLLWGAGGGGGRGTGVVNVGGGGGGACVPFVLAAALLAASETVTIAAGGPGTAIDGPGTVGGNSTFGSLVTAYGGGGGGGANGASRTGGSGGGALSAGGTSTSTTIPFGGQPGQCGGSNLADNHGYGGAGGSAGGQVGGRSAYGGAGGSAGNAIQGGSSVYGGAGGGGAETAAGAGGTSVFGGNGGAGLIGAGTATAGSAPGGGGGANRGGTSGAGARGEARIWGIV